MDNQSGISVYGPGSTEEQPILRSGELTAAYSIGRTPAGDYFALGTIRTEKRDPIRPAWVIIGTGSSQNDAIQQLNQQLERQAQRFQLS